MSQETIFGIHAVLAALEKQTFKQVRLFISQSRHDLKQVKILKLAKQQSVAIKRVERATLDQMSDGGNHQGVLLQGEMIVKVFTERDLFDMVEQAQNQALILLLDSIQDPHNLGACLRSADAVGVTAIVIAKDKSCSITPVVRKIASGAAENVPVVTVTNLARTLQDLQKKNCWAVGLAGEAEESLYDLDLRGPMIIAMGSEGSGLRRLVKEKCDFLARLPMKGSVDSLNVSVATGVALYEALRQRSQS